MTARWSVAGLVLVAALVGLSGCSSGASKSAAAGGDAPFTLKDRPVRTDRVDLPKSYKFQPRVIEVRQGTTVVWTNHDDFPHTVQVLAGAEPASHDLPVGQTVSIRFDKPGTVYYRCSVHPAQMKGEVIVTG